MRRGKKAFLAAVMSVVLSAGSAAVPGGFSVSAAYAAEQNEAVMPFRELTTDELVAEMGMGWNLGNTFDGHTGFTPNETQWQNVTTTKECIKAVHDLGFNTVRIPVTWGTMIDDENDYAIDEAWISRIQDVVDYCVSQDMYAIINIHHDGAEQTGWLRIATDDMDGLEEKYAGVWKTIAERFAGYDEHLIFESMNEVRGTGMTTNQENEVISNLNQIFVDTVRKSGGNNDKRFLVVTGQYNYIISVTKEGNGFTFPKDSVEDRIIISVHDYTPWSFCGDESMGTTESSLKQLESNKKELAPLYETYTSKGIPVIVGEYGCINKDNAVERAYYLEGMNRIYAEYGLVGIYWDQGWYDRTQKPDYSFTIVDRETGEAIDKNVTDAMVRGFYGTGAENLSDIVRDTEVTAFTQITPDKEKLELKVGDAAQISVTTEPEASNDVVLWQTDDDTVATVYNGAVHAKGEGSTTIRAFAQSGSVTAEIQVTVSKADMKDNAKITVEDTALSFTAGEYTYLNAELESSDSADYLYYVSSDEKVATVSPIGKVLAIGEGEAVITVKSASGQSEEVQVSVTNAEQVHSIDLAINVYYNDSKHSFFQNEISSDVITVTRNGQYTLTFDCERDLSEAAAAAGVDSLANLTAIYIKDNQVSLGAASTSPLLSCDITYDRIVVNGVELTITKPGPKAAQKSSGIFDTNDPINSWDGSAVEEAAASGQVANFVGIENPKTIEITFTLTNIVYADGVSADELEQLEPSGEDEPEETTAGTERDEETASAEESESVNDAEETTQERAETSTAEAQEASDTAEKPSQNGAQWIYVIIAIIAVVIVAAVIVLVILKKKEHQQ